MIIDSTHPSLPTHGGGKAIALSRLEEVAESCRASIPEWFVVTPDAKLDTTLIVEKARAMSCEKFAVRSSGQQEDGRLQSYAGQFDSYLEVPLDSLIERIKDVHSSHLNERLSTYKADTEIQPPAAIVQAMIHPKISGVAFSADPVSGRRANAVVTALWGTGTAIVSGEHDADQWSVDRTSTIIARNIADKPTHHQPDSSGDGGVKECVTDESLRHIPCLNDEQILQVTQLVRACESFFDTPQDIEWAFTENALFLLQSRPITTLDNLPDPDDPPLVWDNSNIAESYSGVTSPLTFTFAQRAYENAYREFCALLSVPKDRIKRHDAVFSKMLGHIRGHVYYNLNSWYEVLALLPGFSLNRPFMEQMMGVKRPLPDEIIDDIVSRTQVSPWRDRRDIVVTLFGLLRARLALGRSIKKFHHRLNLALETPDIPLESMSIEQLRDHYNTLEKQLLRAWDAPLVNDFFAMIATGILKSICEKWLGDSSAHHQYLIQTGDIISLEPARRIRSMALLAKTSPKLSQTLASPDLDTTAKLHALRQVPKLSSEFDRYLNDFGDRCLEELKLESVTLADNPAPLLSSIGIMALSGERDSAPEPNAPATPALPWLKRIIFRKVSSDARKLIRQRENLRFERTRLFGRVRKIFVHIGKQLEKENQIEHVVDVFFLHLDELLDPNFDQHHKQIEQRRAKQDGFSSPPPDRFITRGAIERHAAFTSDLINNSDTEEFVNADLLNGIGACPGIVTGTVRVVTNPRDATLQHGEILVAKQTDPGWIVLFPAASALIVERGSLLSHSAIVARELNLPCVVSVSDVTERLATGDQVEVNGSTGVIRRLNPIQST